MDAALTLVPIHVVGLTLRQYGLQTFAGKGNIIGEHEPAVRLPFLFHPADGLQGILECGGALT